MVQSQVLPKQSGNTIPFPAQQQPRPQSRLEKLLWLEGKIRELPSRQAMHFHAVNDARDLLQFDIAFAIRISRAGKGVIEAASDVSQIDKGGELQRKVILQLGKLKDIAKLQALSGVGRVWVPFVDRKGKCFGGLVLLRQQPWTDPDLVIVKRVGETYAHGIAALTPPKLLRGWGMPKWSGVAIAAALLLGALVPVPMTALAPFEVVADQPVLVTAPIDGVVADILVEPNSPVIAGTKVFRFDATELQAAFDVARQKVVVADAKLKTTQKAAFRDPKMNREVSILEKELRLAEAELAYAADQLKRVDVVASRDGVLVYGAKSDWIGKPLRVGEKVMEIADPAKIAYRVDLAVADAIALREDSPVRLFFDADPLNPMSGRVVEASYHAAMTPENVLAFRIKAKADDAKPMRIGLRGTAQITGEQVSLWFYLFRRPISAIRQQLGL